MDKLRQATALLREQNGHLAEFLSADPKGKLLPAYLGTVADQLAGEQTKLIELMNSVSQHIQHIKEIVAMQQTMPRCPASMRISTWWDWSKMPCRSMPRRLTGITLI